MSQLAVAMPARIRKKTEQMTSGRERPIIVEGIFHARS